MTIEMHSRLGCQHNHGFPLGQTSHCMLYTRSALGGRGRAPVADPLSTGRQERWRLVHLAWAGRSCEGVVAQSISTPIPSGAKMRLRVTRLVLHQRVLIGTRIASVDLAEGAARLDSDPSRVGMVSGIRQTCGRRQLVRAHSGHADDERMKNLSAGEEGSS
jgi:hypothetical protein